MTTKDPSTWAEAWLVEEKTYLESNNIWPSKIQIIARMHDAESRYRADLHRFYCDLAKKLPNKLYRARALDGLLGVMALYHPKRIREVKEKVDEVDSINREMAELCKRMASLHETRHRLSNEHDMTFPDDAHPLDWIKHGLSVSDPTTSFLHKSFVAPELERVDHFDLRYWPTPEDVFSGLARLYEENYSDVNGNTMTMALMGNNGNRALMRALWEEQSRHRPDTRPAYRLTDASIATLVCVTTDDTDATSGNTVKIARRELIKHLQAQIDQAKDEAHLERQLAALLEG